MADTPALPERLSDAEIEHILSTGKWRSIPTPTAQALAREVRDLRRAALVASPAHSINVPLDPNGHGVYLAECICGQWKGSTPGERRDLVEMAQRHLNEMSAVASPRREAPADAVEALATTLIDSCTLAEAERADIGDEWEIYEALARILIRAGYQLVPEGHHVSPEGQTVIDGKRWEAVDAVRDVINLDTGEVAFWELDVRPVGTEEADTDG